MSRLRAAVWGDHAGVFFPSFSTGGRARRPSPTWVCCTTFCHPERSGYRAVEGSLIFCAFVRRTCDHVFPSSDTTGRRVAVPYMGLLHHFCHPERSGYRAVEGSLIFCAFVRRTCDCNYPITRYAGSPRTSTPTGLTYIQHLRRDRAPARSVSVRVYTFLHRYRSIYKLSRSLVR